MKGCKYNCIVQSLVPENMIGQLNLIYQASELIVKVNDRQWFHVFNREHCLTLRELLEFLKRGFIEIQRGQILLLMTRIIQKFYGNIIQNVVHGNLTFDNVWIINTGGFWPHNQQHNYEIVFVNYQGGPSDNPKMQEILLALNDLGMPKKRQRILDLFVGSDNQLKERLMNLIVSLKGKVDAKTQKVTGLHRETSISNKFKPFADLDVFQKCLPIHNSIHQTKIDKSLSWQYIDESRNIIIDQIFLQGQKDIVLFAETIEAQISKYIDQKRAQKFELINYLTSNAKIKIEDFIDQSMIEFEQIFKFQCNTTIKQKQPEYIQNLLKSIEDNYFEFNSDLAKQIEIIQPIFERELLKTQKQILKDLMELFVEQSSHMIEFLV